MKKRLEIALSVFLIISIILLIALWGSAKHSKDDVRRLAQAGATDAYSNFLEYQTTGDESHYWYGVAGFRSFEQAYHLLTEGTNKSPNYTFCNEVYGYLVLFPEKCQNHIPEITEVMAVLASDVEDENGYIRMAELRNTMLEIAK